MLAALVDGDVAFADHLARRLLSSGVPFVQIARDVLSPVQREVGRRWAAGDLGIADEHAASVAVGELLSMLSPRAADPDGPVVVVASPEHDHHGLGCRVVACALSLEGCRVLDLGPSVPAADLAEYVEGQEPVAVALSVSLTSSLASAARSITAAHSVDVPVVIGGRAVAHAQRAAALGADAHADLGGVFDVVNSWSAAPPATLTVGPEMISEHDELERRWYLLVGQALDDVLDDAKVDAAMGEELHRLLLVAEGALLLGEPTLVTDIRRWLTESGPGRGISAERVNAMIVALASHLGDGLRRVHDLLVSG